MTIFEPKWLRISDPERIMAASGIVEGRTSGTLRLCRPAAFRCAAAKGSFDFAKVCLEEKHVAVVPGKAFGEDRCVRLSYATSMEKIEEGLARIAALADR